MIHEFRLAVAANKTKASPVTLELLLTSGIITMVNVFWPPGSQQLGHLIVRQGAFQVWPSRLGSDLTGDGELVVYPEWFRLRKPARLEMVAWNDDTRFAHTVTLRFNLIRTSEASQARLVSELSRVRKVLELWLQGSSPEPPGV